MNEHLIRRLFPNVSKSCLAANSEPAEFRLEIEEGRQDSGKVAPASAKLERNLGHGALGEGQAKAGNPDRFFVRVTSVRRRLIDEDNLCEKYVIDCCRYAGLLPGDGPGTTRIEATQRKAGKEEAEHTVVEIFAVLSDEQFAASGKSD